MWRAELLKHMLSVKFFPKKTCSFARMCFALFAFTFTCLAPPASIFLSLGDSCIWRCVFDTRRDQG